MSLLARVFTVGGLSSFIQMAGTQDDDDIAANMEQLGVSVNGGEYDPNSPMA
jgi:hypothetical protein